MAKTKISEYSSTANSNTDIAAINIDEGCAPSGINNAIRALMAQLKDFQTGAASDPLTVGGVLTVTGGSAAAPAVTTSGDTNTGILFPAADTVAISTGGTERARVDSSGNLGLGVTPSAWANSWKVLELSYGSFRGNAGGIGIGGNVYNNSSNVAIYKANGAASSYDTYDGAHYWFRAPSGTAGNPITFTQAMTLDASGNLGVGTTSPTRKFQVSNTAADPFISILGAASNNGGLLFGDNASDASGQIRYDHSSDALYFVTNASERARIDSSGSLLVGTTSSLAKIVAYSNTANERMTSFTRLPDDSNFQMGFKNGASGSGAGVSFGRLSGWYAGSELAYIDMTRSGGASCQDIRVVCGSGGVYITNGGTSWSSLSDERQKTALTPIENALSKVATLRTVTGRYLTDEPEKRRAFLIAQDVQAVLPEAVNEQPDEAKTLGLQYTDTIPLLVAAIKEQQAIIEQLQADVAALKGQA